MAPRESAVPRVTTMRNADGYYKQATVGRCVDKAPGRLQVRREGEGKAVRKRGVLEWCAVRCPQEVGGVDGCEGSHEGGERASTGGAPRMTAAPLRRAAGAMAECIIV